MKHYILRLSISFCILLSPSFLFASNAFFDTINIPTEVEENGELSFEIRGNVLHIVGAQGLSLEIYDITGKRVYLSRIESNDKRITLNLGKGCYIVKVGNTTRKITIS